MTRARSLSRLANTNAFTVDASQNVGIGSTQPDVRLDVNGDMNVTGTLTYEDVTNVETAGITTTGGLVVTGLGATIGGITTFFGDLNFGAAGVGGTITTLGHGGFTGIVTALGFEATGVITAASFRGDGSQLSGVDSSNLVDSGDTNRVAANTSGVVITGITTTTGNLNINGTPPWTVTGGNYGNISISGDDASSAGFLWMGNGAAATNADFDLGRVNFSNGSTIVSQIKGSTFTSANDDGRISFFAKSTGGSLLERLRITPDGTLRQTGGDDSLASGETVAKITHRTIDTTTPGGVGDVTTLETVSSTSNGSDYRFVITKREGSGGGSCFINLGGSSDGSISFGTNSSGSGTERLRVTSAGRVRHQNSGGETIHELRRTDANTSGSIGTINFTASDSHSVASISALGDGDNEGAHIIFRTTSAAADNSPYNAATPERVRINSSGDLIVDAGGEAQDIQIKSHSANSGHGIIYMRGNSSNERSSIQLNHFGHADWFISAGGTGNGEFSITNTDQGTDGIKLNADGDLLPGDDDTQDLGSSSLRWANIYSADLQLSNEGSSNDVDGTWGKYTIQEGENDLFLLNRRNGKKYRFMLEEV
jgi:hypothetical protein